MRERGESAESPRKERKGRTAVDVLKSLRGPPSEKVVSIGGCSGEEGKVAPFLRIIKRKRKWEGDNSGEDSFKPSTADSI